MLGFSFAEIILILLVIIIFIRPKDLPQIAYFGGKLFYKLKNLFFSLKKTCLNMLDDFGLQDIKEEMNRGISEEKSKYDSKKPTIIIDMYGNEHEVHDINDLRSDLANADLQNEIAKENKKNAKKKKPIAKKKPNTKKKSGAKNKNAKKVTSK